MPKLLNEDSRSITYQDDAGKTRTIAKAGIDELELQNIRDVLMPVGPEAFSSVPLDDIDKMPVNVGQNSEEPISSVPAIKSAVKNAAIDMAGLVVPGITAMRGATTAVRGLPAAVEAYKSHVLPTMISAGKSILDPSAPSEAPLRPKTIEEENIIADELNSSRVPVSAGMLTTTPVTDSSVSVSQTTPNVYEYQLPGTEDILLGTEKLNAMKRMQAMAEQASYEEYKNLAKDADDKQKELKDTFDTTYSKTFDDMSESLKQLDNSKLKDYWEDKSIFSRIFAALLIGGGEYARMKTGGQTNLAKEMIDSAIEQNYKRQKANLELKQGEVNNKRNLLNDIKGKFSDEAEQYKAYRLVLGDNLRIKLLDMSAKNAGNIIGAQAQIEAGKIQNENTKLLAELQQTRAQTALLNKKAEQDASKDKNLATWFTNYQDTKNAIIKMKEYIAKNGTFSRVIDPETRKQGDVLATTLRSAVQKVEGWGTRYNEDMRDRFDKLLGEPADILNPLEELSNYEAALDAKAEVRKLYGTAEGQPSLLGEAQDYSEDIQ